MKYEYMCLVPIKTIKVKKIAAPLQEQKVTVIQAIED